MTHVLAIQNIIITGFIGIDQNRRVRLIRIFNEDDILCHFFKSKFVNSVFTMSLKSVILWILKYAKDVRTCLQLTILFHILCSYFYTNIPHSNLKERLKIVNKIHCYEIRYMQVHVCTRCK
jgi:hypothetical protein